MFICPVETDSLSSPLQYLSPGSKHFFFFFEAANVFFPTLGSFSSSLWFALVFAEYFTVHSPPWLASLRPLCGLVVP